MKPSSNRLAFQYYRAIVRVRDYKKMSSAMPVCARTYQAVCVRTSAAIMSRPSPASVDTSSAHISIQSLLLQLDAAEMVIHVAEASICRRRQSFLSYSASVLLLVDRRQYAEGIYRYQYILHAHTYRMVGTRYPRETYHSRYDLLLQYVRELRSNPPELYHHEG